MAQLWIKFTDQEGEFRRVAIDKDVFTIGRGSSCDLVVQNTKLSREHLKIERHGDRFIVSDNRSSNGTELNYGPLLEPTEIMNGDRADLGGGLDIVFEFTWDEPASAKSGDANASGLDSQAAQSSLTVVPPAQLPVKDAGSGFPIAVLILGPLAVILLLVFGVVLVLLFSSGTTTNGEITSRSRTVRQTDDQPDSSPTPSERTTTSTSSSNGETNISGNGNTSQPPPANLSENAKLEKNAAAFLRRIAQNDSTAFLTSEQAQKVSSRIKQLSGSSAVSANIDSARKSSSQLKSLAQSKNLPPQLLATAALAKLGSTRGDVLQTAQSMSEVFEKLNTQIGSERSDDSLMMVAAFDQGQRGDFMGLRNTLQDLSTKFPESSRSIRSIWFLQKQGKISGPEFDFALQFLAIGTICQNPKDFGLNTEPLTL
jgi:pSer/pThr/pTyr-binding forkhead associated (FHA) protein